MENYRKKYKEYYGIDFSSDYHIHHIDLDRTNNDISNLILLPKGLHAKYHFYLSRMHAKDGLVSVSYKIDIWNGMTMDYDLMKGFCEAMQEINKWKLKKIELEMSRENMKVD